MGQFLGFVFLIIIIVALCWRWISPWLARMAQRRMEDFIRSRMGMPSRKEEEKARRAADKARRAAGRGDDRRARTRTYGGRESIIPKEYAEDVEFVEIKEFEQTDIATDRESGGRRHTRFTRTETIVESQIEDADFTEIK